MTRRPSEGPAAVPVDLKGQPLIDFYSDGVRIGGLVWEDRVRTTNLFLMGSVAFSPIASVDIASDHDLVLGLPTHVKASKSGNIGMASSMRLFELSGSQRLVIGLYTVETHVGPNGTKIAVHCYHTVYEIILSDVTLQAMRGGVSIDEVRKIDKAMRAYTPDLATLKDKKLEFHKETAKIRPRMGIARCTGKIDIEQSRLQSYLSLRKLIAHMMTEGPHRGQLVQANCIEYTRDFHGLTLPWRTTNNQHIFSKPADPDRPVRKRKSARQEKPAVDPDTAYVGKWVDRVDIPVPGGVVYAIPHAGGMHTIGVKQGDDEFRRRISRTCQAAGGRWIAADRVWLMTTERAREAVRAIRNPPPPPVAPLPEADGPSIMKQLDRAGTLFEFRTHDGLAVRAMRQPHSSWALRAHDGDEVAARIDAVCQGREGCDWNDRWRNWLVRQAPTDLIERIARAVAEQPPSRR